MISWKLESKKISDLKPHSKNPRFLSKEQYKHLKTSLEKFGISDKPIINQDGTIIGGHQRVNLIKKMGLKEIDCWIPDKLLDENDVDELNIRLNKNIGEWDWDVLANEWNISDLIEWGFTTDELIGSVQDSITNENQEDEKVLEPPKDEDAITKTGDIYQLNEHRIICGDSTIQEYVEKLLNGAKPILMVTDPPYGVEYDPLWRERAGKGCRASGKVQNDNRVNWFDAWNLFHGSIAYVWCASWFLPEVAKSLDDCNYERKSLIIWVKQHFALSRGDYHWQHEPCWYAIKKGHSHNWQGARDQSTIWEISNLCAYGKSKEEDRTSHSTQKPIECMERPIRNNTAKGEGVYDPFLGSGTTLIASEKLDRICYGIEISRSYVDIIISRWVNYMKKNNKPFFIKKNGEIILWPEDQKHK